MARRRRKELSQAMRSAAGYDYSYNDMLAAYSELGVTTGRMIYVGADLTRLMRYQEPGRENLLSAHLRAIRELLGPTGTIFVPAASLNLCNTEIVFDVQTTESSNMGLFAEYVRKHPEAVRSFHPFWSVAGIGPVAANLLNDVPRHSYGWGSVFHRFVEHDVLGLNIGKSPHYSISVVHHVETAVGVPYRYTKEFIHPVRRNGRIEREPFYLSVLYRDCDIVRDRNRKILENFARHDRLREVQLGRGKAWSFSHADFFKTTVNFLSRDLYGWLDRPPTKRPYQL
jgi:aminoglycoside 3-N-acetyltransferase